MRDQSATPAFFSFLVLIGSIAWVARETSTGREE
jgi:hypothetical protein